MYRMRFGGSNWREFLNSLDVAGFDFAFVFVFRGLSRVVLDFVFVFRGLGLVLLEFIFVDRGLGLVLVAEAVSLFVAFQAFFTGQALLREGKGSGRIAATGNFGVLEERFSAETVPVPRVPMRKKKQRRIEKKNGLVQMSSEECE